MNTEHLLLRDLPNELVIEALQFLPLQYLLDTVSLVSHQFNENVMKHTRYISLHRTRIKNKEYHNLTFLIPRITKFSGITTLYLDDIKKDVSEWLLTELSTHCPKLTSLSLQNNSQLTSFRIDDSVTLKLEHLDLTCCSKLANIVITGSNIAKSMTSLNLSHTPVTDSDIQHYCNHLVNLKRLVLKGCRNIKQPSLVNSNLELLNLRQCTELKYVQDVNCPKLVHLNLSSSKIYDGHLGTILSYVGNQLTYLELRRCSNLFSLSTSVTQFQLERLVTLHINHTGVTDEYVEYITSKCKNLEILEISWCTEVKQPVIQHEKLLFLYMDFSSEISDDLLVICPKLSKLNIASTNLSEKWLLRTMEDCYCELKQVNMEGCPNLADAQHLYESITTHFHDKISTTGNTVTFLNQRGRKANTEPAFSVTFSS